LDNPEQRLHRLEAVIWRLPFQQLNDDTANAPAEDG
jgi:hypothetical protein